MAKRRFTIKTIKETDPQVFDDKVNALLTEGYELDKSRIVSTDTEVYFIAFTRMREIRKSKPEGSVPPEGGPDLEDMISKNKE